MYDYTTDYSSGFAANVDLGGWGITIGQAPPAQQGGGWAQAPREPTVMHGGIGAPATGQEGTVWIVVAIVIAFLIVQS